ncbi:MAG: hypothetical protein ACO2O0_02025, partial [Desulfurococcales archaeon]
MGVKSVKGLSAVQAVIYVVLLVVGIAAGYAIGGSMAAPATKALTVTITPAAMGLRDEILIGTLLPLSGDLASEGPLNK